MLNVLDEDILELVAEAFVKRILNTESDFIWKEPEDSMYVIRHPYDPGPDILDNHEPRRKRGLNEDETAMQFRSRSGFWLGGRRSALVEDGKRKME